MRAPPPPRSFVLPQPAGPPTSTVPATPPATAAGTGEGKRPAAKAGLTVMPAWEPVMLPVTVSVAVTDCVPAVLRVTLKECAPASALVEGYPPGSIACASALLRVVVPV